MDHIRQLCRLCLMSNEHVMNMPGGMISLHENGPLIDVIYSTTSIRVFDNQHDTVHYLCQYCEQTLQAFNVFRTRCIANDTVYKTTYSLAENDQCQTVEMNIQAVEPEPCSDQEYTDECWLSEGTDVVDELEKCDGQPEMRYQCETCSKTFKRRSELKIHTTVHNGERAYGCETCGKTFRHRISLMRHKRTHTGEKPFRCTDCNASFADQGNMKKHALIHAGIKRFHCVICSKNFTQKKSLILHSRMHTGEKPYRCQCCDKAFSDPNSLRSHIQTLSGLKPHHCTVCGKGFRQRGDLSRHVLMHTNEKPNGCPSCDKKFRRRHHLNVHMRKIHGSLQSASNDLQ